MPGKWGFHEVPESEKQPGDLVMFFDDGIAFHSGIYIGRSLFFGPMMNHSVGYLPYHYVRHFPYMPFDKALDCSVKYYRHDPA